MEIPIMLYLIGLVLTQVLVIHIIPDVERRVLGIVMVLWPLIWGIVTLLLVKRAIEGIWKALRGNGNTI